MLETIAKRRSIRKYEAMPVPEGQVLALLESARAAPSGNNSQPWRFVVVRDAGMRAAVVGACADQKWMLQAPVLIVCVADLSSRMPGAVTAHRVDEASPEEDVKRIIRDTAIAAEHIVLEACALGLGTCWVSWFAQDEMRAVLGVPEDKYVVSVLTVGYAAEDPAPRPRKRLNELVRYERW